MASRLNKQKKAARSEFTRCSQVIEAELAKEEKDLEKIKIEFLKLTDKHKRLDEIHEGYLNLVLDDETDADGKKYAEAKETVEKYRDTYLEISGKIGCLEEKRVASSIASNHTDNVPRPENSEIRKRLKLPELKLKTFGDSDIKGWFGFWSSFSHVHESKELSDSTKLAYLTNCMEKGSEPKRVVETFPAKGENYKKVVKRLLRRYGRETTLVQVYVRELLSLVVGNVSKGRKSTDIGALYDSLETQLRALESLGRTQEKFADFLNPLVESCLPEDLLISWQRRCNEQWSRANEDDDEDDEKEPENDSGKTLKNLMFFLEQEVNNQRLFKMARDGFGLNKDSKTEKNTAKEEKGQVKTPTSASLVSTGSTPAGKVADYRRGEGNCVFCSKSSHSTKDCFASRKLALEDKKKLLLDKNCCFACLRPGHGARTCRSNVRCIVCSGRHYPILCPDLESKSSQSSEIKSTIPTQTLSSSIGVMVYLKTLSVFVEYEDKVEKARVLFDSGSQKSYVSSSLVRKIGMKNIDRTRISHGLFGGQKMPAKEHDVYQLFLSSIDGDYRCNFEVMEHAKICGEIPVFPAENFRKVLQEKNIEVEKFSDQPSEIDILIGADVYGRLITEEIQPLEDGLVAMKTKLGWTVMGKDKTKDMYSNNVLICSSLLNVDRKLPDLWHLDSLGIKDPIETKNKNEREKSCLLKFQETVTELEDGRYQVELPWREDHPHLPDNRELAFRRNQAVKEKLKRENGLQSYSEVFRDWLDTGIIEKVPPEEIRNYGHYLPHRPVIKESSSTTKIRPVFDASAHTKNSPSLNDCLEKGQILIELIPDVLDRFRMKAIGVSSDVEKAFLQIEVEPKHRDYLRFFHPETNQVMRHRRVVFGVTSSPFLLLAIVDYHLSRVSPENQSTAELLKKSFYVDNCLTSVSSVEELNQFVEESVDIMNRAHFNLRCWESNAKSSYTTAEDKDIPVLGLLWNLRDDTLRCNLSSLQKDKEEQTTKRSVLSVAQRLFDPVGVTCPATLLPKRLLQELWSKNLGWDDPLPEIYRLRFEQWRNQIVLLSELRFPRFVGLEGELQLHCFVDASSENYAACVFARVENSSQVNVCLLRAKSRVVPTKGATIPRLELMAACIGARLTAEVERALGIESRSAHFWSDSMTTLWWIKKGGPSAVFVQNRVKEIREISNPENWKHVPGKLNPADLPSRGCTPAQLIESKWWEGPKWLRENEENWPRSDEILPTEDALSERKKGVSNVTVSHNIQEERSDSSETPWYLQHFSDYHTVKRMVAWVLRFIGNILARISQRRNKIKLQKLKDPSIREENNLSLDEIREAEVTLLRLVQEDCPEIVTKLDSNQLKLDKSGIYRVRTPISTRKDTEDFLYPVLLPGKHPLVICLIEHSHRLHKHAGPSLLLTVLREEYWIISARKTIRQVLSKCVRCQRYRSKHKTSTVATLPEERVRDAAVHEVTGIDLCGPLHLKDGSKVWVVLFTCAVYRAIHIELVTSLSVEAFLQALRRFIARKGRPSIIWTDNGTNFVGSDNAFSKLDWGQIARETEVNRIQWRFNPPSAPWWGGWWERLVGLVKNLLRINLGRASLNYEELSTLLCDCEGLLNSRPLTYLSGDEADLIPLTPAMFFRDIPDSRIPEIDQIDAEHLRKRVRYRQRLSSVLRSRFRIEYLGQLGRLGRRRPATHSVRVGEVVLIGDDNRKRLDWPLGRIEAIYPGRDGEVRTVRVRTQGGALVRPVQRIYPLEVEVRDSDCESDKSQSNQNEISESSNCDKENLSESITEVSPEVQKFVKTIETRSGRIVKKPKCLDLFDQVLFSFSES